EDEANKEKRTVRNRSKNGEVLEAKQGGGFLQGCYVGRRVVIVKCFNEGIRDCPYNHCLVVGIKKCPSIFICRNSMDMIVVG
ncbi:hypothetical protein J1N35_021968, partial [Gossypium stocksii]